MVYRVIGVDITILQYVCCHEDDSNNFWDMTQFSVLQEASVIYVFYSSWSSSQFHVEISCCHHVHLHKYIYYYYAEELILFPKMFNVKFCSTYAYNWVHFWLLQFPEQFLYPALHIYFQHYTWYFYYFQSVFISHWVHLFDIICYWMTYVFIFCTNQSLVFDSNTYTMTYNICHLHLWYIWDIYLHMNCYWLIHFITCYYCHSQNNATVYNWYMSWNMCM